MTQDEKWLVRYKELVAFIVKNERNPSKYDALERGLYVNWLRHNRKLYNTGELKADRIGRFRELLVLSERYKRQNQYV